MCSNAVYNCRRENKLLFNVTSYVIVDSCKYSNGKEYGVYLLLFMLNRYRLCMTERPFSDVLF